MRYFTKKGDLHSKEEKSRVKKRWDLAVTALLCSLLLGTPVDAQEKNAAEAAKQPSYELDAVTVTAQKRTENVQEIPMSVSVFSEGELEDAGIKDTNEVVRYTPNVFVKDSASYQQTTIRGVGSFVTSMYSGTAMYVDDINLPLVFMQNQDLFDVTRVEVLKGPQGTLYGRNSEAGVINIVTRQPDNTVRRKLFSEFNMYDTNHGTAPGYQLGGSASGPFVQDKLFFNVTGKWDYNLGDTKNNFTAHTDATEIKRFLGRGQLRWTPTEQLDIALLADQTNSNDQFGYGHYIDGQYKSSINSINRDGEDTRDWQGNSQSLRVKYKGESVDFLSVTGRRYFGDNSKWDLDSTADLSTDVDASMRENDYMLSQEFRLSSSEKSESPFTWLLGTYGFTEQLDLVYDSLAQIQYGGMNMLSDAYRNTKISVNGYAMFGQGTYTLFDRLHLTAGLRYDYTNQWGRQDLLNFMSMGGWDSATPDTYGKRLTSGEWLPKFSISYDITKKIMSYATVSRGYLTGGYDYCSATSRATLTYNPEYTWNYEVGFKTSWFDNRLIANVAGFYIDMSDKQASEVIAGNLTKISNVGKANSKGFEVELKAKPLKGLELMGGFGYTQTKITEWYDLADNYNYYGKELPNTPKYTYNLGAMYRHDSGLFGRVDLLGTGEYYYNAKNTQALKEPGYELVNLRLGYMKDDLNVTLWCKNLFDREYHTVRASIPGYGTLAFDGDPRQFGVTVAYTF